MLQTDCHCGGEWWDANSEEASSRQWQGIMRNHLTMRNPSNAWLLLGVASVAFIVLAGFDQKWPVWHHAPWLLTFDDIGGGEGGGRGCPARRIRRRLSAEGDLQHLAGTRGPLLECASGCTPLEILKVFCVSAPWEHISATFAHKRSRGERLEEGLGWVAGFPSARSRELRCC